MFSTLKTFCKTFMYVEKVRGRMKAFGYSAREYEVRQGGYRRFFRQCVRHVNTHSPEETATLLLAREICGRFGQE